MNELLKALREQAQMMANYRAQLIEAGFTNEQAMNIIIAYQTALINANQMALIEREKNQQLAFTFQNNRYNRFKN